MNNNPYDSSNQQSVYSSAQYGNGYTAFPAVPVQQTTTFSTYQPAPAFGSKLTPQQVVYSSQQGFFAGQPNHHSHQQPPHHHEPVFYPPPSHHHHHR